MGKPKQLFHKSGLFYIRHPNLSLRFVKYPFNLTYVTSASIHYTMAFTGQINMKNILFFLIIIFSCNSILFAELTKEQLWAISLTGFMTERNGSSRNTLNADEINEENIKKWLDILKRDWDINNREELLITLETMENSGHASALENIQQIVAEIMNLKQTFSIFDIYNNYRVNQRQYNYLKFTALNWDSFKNRTILAWDLGRNISLCRWGYEVGFLTEEEAWEKIMYYAEKIQSLYNSWDEYGYDYYMGRIFWASGFGEDINYTLQTDPIYKKLVTGYWSHIDWYTDLKTSDKNDTVIETIRYQKPANNDGILQFLTNDPNYYNRWLSHYMDNPGTDKNIIQCKVKKISGADNYGFGVLFCVDNSNLNNVSFYRLFITVNGLFTVQKMSDGKWITPAPIGWRNSSYLKTGYNVFNHIKIEKINNNGIITFNIYFNDNFSATFFDEAPLNGDRMGLVTAIDVLEKEMFPHIPVDVRFDY